MQCNTLCVKNTKSSNKCNRLLLVGLQKPDHFKQFLDRVNDNAYWSVLYLILFALVK